MAIILFLVPLYFLLHFCIISAETARTDVDRLSNRKSKSCTRENTVLFLPLDERYTTRDAFLMLAESTDYCILTPPKEMLPYWKYNCDIEKLHSWVDETLPLAKTAIISSEMYLYGGLINSRLSNDTTAEVISRANNLVDYSLRYPDLTIYLSNVVMRIPSYDGDFEEPWYWENYGSEIYSYSFYTDKYNQLGEESDKATAEYYASLVPQNAIGEFLWRRERNYNVTSYILGVIADAITVSPDRGEIGKELDRQKLKSLRGEGRGLEGTTDMTKAGPFRYFYITLDDSAEYGFNIREAEMLKDTVERFNLAHQVPIYPGADEVQLVQLARFSLEERQGLLSTASPSEKQSWNPVRFALYYRDPATIGYIPNYEGQAMEATLLQQIEATGSIVACTSTSFVAASSYVGSLSQRTRGTILDGIAVCDDDLSEKVDAVLLVNNFSEEKQLEAADQPIPGDSEAFASFDKVIQTQLAVKPIGFCDNRYSNGADIALVDYLTEKTQSDSLRHIAYAGWNTNGNTIGTVVANTVLLQLFSFGSSSSSSSSGAGIPRWSAEDSNAAFNSLRLTEDMGYQALHRQTLRSYLDQLQSPVENSSNLTTDIGFYERYSYKLLSSSYQSIAESFQLPWKLQEIFYPWNRTFEIGLISTWKDFE